MLKLAKILHSKGFHITFVNTEYNQKRLQKSQGSIGLPSFQFETIPDGLPPPENLDVTQDIPSLLKSTSETCLKPFKKLLLKLNNTAGIPPVTSVVSDGVMSFTLDVAEELVIPEVLFWTTNACGFLAYADYITLKEKGLIPLKEQDVLNELSLIYPSVYSIGPLHTMVRNIEDKDLQSLGSSLWKEEPECLEWLDCQECGFVIYVNFRSITVISPQQLKEFSWGLANNSADLTNGYLETKVDCIPSMEGIRLKEIPNFIKTTDPDDFMIKKNTSIVESEIQTNATMADNVDESKELMH
nr:7-deoxyloganetin glucosyltransferase-like [Tanacetum cinerariifolium]